MEKGDADVGVGLRGKMVSLLLYGDTSVLPSEKITQHVRWEVEPHLPLATLSHLQALQKLLRRPMPLDEVSLFYVRGTDSECAGFHTLDSRSTTWVPLDPGLSAEQLGLCDESPVFLSCDPYSIFASRRVALPSALLPRGVESLPLEEGNDDILTESGQKTMLVEEQRAYPFWIPLVRGPLRWRICHPSTKDLILCGSSERRVVKIGGNGWVNGLASLSFSLGEWMQLLEASGTPSCGVSMQTVSWSVFLNSIGEGAARRTAELQARYQLQRGNSGDDVDVETHCHWEVSQGVRHALLRGRPSHSVADEATVGATLLSYVANPGSSAQPPLVADGTSGTSPPLEHLSPVTPTKTDGGRKQDEARNTSRPPSVDVVGQDDGHHKKMATLEDAEEMRFPPCVLVGVAFPHDIDRYLAAASAAVEENTVFDDASNNVGRFSPLQGYFLDPYTGFFFVGGTLSHLAPLQRVSTARPSLGTAVTITVHLGSRLLNVVMDGEVVLSVPLRVTTMQEALLLRPVVQLFSTGAVADLH